MYHRNRPRGRPPMLCPRIDTITYGRSSEQSKTKLRTKMCSKREQNPYLPYKCHRTPSGCRSKTRKQHLFNYAKYQEEGSGKKKVQRPAKRITKQVDVNNLEKLINKLEKMKSAPKTTRKSPPLRSTSKRKAPVRYRNMY